MWLYEDIKHYKIVAMNTPFALHEPTFLAQPLKLRWCSICLAGEVWKFCYVWVLFWKLFWLCHTDVCGFFQVWMYEYFGFGPQVWEEVNGIDHRSLRWLPKYRLSTPSQAFFGSLVYVD